MSEIKKIVVVENDKEVECYLIDSSCTYTLERLKILSDIAKSDFSNLADHQIKFGVCGFQHPQEKAKGDLVIYFSVKPSYMVPSDYARTLSYPCWLCF